MSPRRRLRLQKPNYYYVHANSLHTEKPYQSLNSSGENRGIHDSVRIGEKTSGDAVSAGAQSKLPMEAWQSVGEIHGFENHGILRWDSFERANQVVVFCSP